MINFLGRVPTRSLTTVAQQSVVLPPDLKDGIPYLIKMVEANWLEIVITSAMIMLIAGILSAMGYLEGNISLFVFMSMGLLGFLFSRAVRGRKFSWR